MLGIDHQQRMEEYLANMLSQILQQEADKIVKKAKEDIEQKIRAEVALFATTLSRKYDLSFEKERLIIAIDIRGGLENK